MQSKENLRQILRRIDRRSYPAYKDTRGWYDFGSYSLGILHVQSDPFAAPSDVAVEVAHAGFPEKYLKTRACRTALEDALLRMFGRALAKKDRTRKASGKSGTVRVSRPGQEVLERTALSVDPETGSLRLNMNVGFPANGRKICSDVLEQILFDQLPPMVEKNLIYDNLTDQQKEMLEEVYELTCNQEAIRDYIEDHGLAAFVANGSVLPRASGASDLPMEEAIAFQSPEDLEISIPVPFGDEIRGMKIPLGVTLIVGGGYHGKSTLLKALERGIWNHVAKDGREYVLTRRDAMKVRAEDGRSVHNEDISMFIQNLPNKKSTVSFTTEDASGSTSQAANVAEALESGSRLLLMDEDTSATNFMVRDELMAEVVSRDEEPIIPFIARIQPLSKNQDVSTILVAGSSGAYFDQADLILQMDQYEPKNITEFAKEKAKGCTMKELLEYPAPKTPAARIMKKNPALDTDRIKIKTNGLDGVSIARELIDTRYLEQLTDPEQLSAIGKMIVYAQKNLTDGERTLQETADELEKIMDEQGLQAFGKGAMARPRKQELLGAVNRWRSAAFDQKED
ncbi:MAG: ABC-ATPase domain-containing protein [Erysipelotrichaceae bacterium]|nr:ABC-ATPase domain-containing protein [Erysipelotrichaceae bacterium]